jgi:hypothetical protein
VNDENNSFEVKVPCPFLVTWGFSPCGGYTGYALTVAC